MSTSRRPAISKRWTINSMDGASVTFGAGSRQSHSAGDRNREFVREVTFFTDSRNKSGHLLSSQGTSTRKFRVESTSTLGVDVAT